MHDRTGHDKLPRQVRASALQEFHVVVLCSIFQKNPRFSRTSLLPPAKVSPSRPLCVINAFLRGTLQFKPPRAHINQLFRWPPLRVLLGKYDADVAMLQFAESTENHSMRAASDIDAYIHSKLCGVVNDLVHLNLDTVSDNIERRCDNKVIAEE